jgi:V/A-type H+/Na+-transporting ATPase subunit E
MRVITQKYLFICLKFFEQSMEKEKKATGDERLAAICQMLRKETLEPAQEEAEGLRLRAEREALKIHDEAKHKADQLLHDTLKHLTDERKAFEAALEQAAHQAVELVKEKVERALFNPALDELIGKDLKDERKVARLIDIVIEKIQEEGIGGDIQVFLGKQLSKDELNRSLCQLSLQKIGKDGLKIGDQKLGVILRVIDKRLSVEITSESVREMMTNFMRPDFRKFLFHG